MCLDVRYFPFNNIIPALSPESALIAWKDIPDKEHVQMPNLLKDVINTFKDLEIIYAKELCKRIKQIAGPKWEDSYYIKEPDVDFVVFS